MAAPHDVDVTTLVERIDRLEAELAALRAAAAPTDGVDHDPPRASRTSRRGLLLGAAVAGAAIAAAPSRPAAAAGALTLEADNTAFAPTKVTLDSANSKEYVFAASDNGLASTGQTGSLVGHSQGAATFVGVLGLAENGAAVAVRGDAGRVTRSGGIGVEGIGAIGVSGSVPLGSVGTGTFWEFVGVRASSVVDGTPPPGSMIAGVSAGAPKGYGVVAQGGLSALYLLGFQVGPPQRGAAGFVGMVDTDSSGGLWHCVANGTPGTWRQLSGPDTAGAFHPITPTRVYDSRTAAPAPGRLAAGETRTVSVADGRDLATGAVSVTGLVPAGATAITCNVTVVGTAGAGFVTLNPGGTTAVTAATVNWSAAGQILNNGVVAKIAADRTVTLVAGGSGGASTDVVVDVTGYFR